MFYYDPTVNVTINDPINGNENGNSTHLIRIVFEAHLPIRYHYLLYFLGQVWDNLEQLPLQSEQVGMVTSDYVLSQLECLAQIVSYCLPDSGVSNGIDQSEHSGKYDMSHDFIDQSDDNISQD